jgi:hypothetical protein
VAQCCDGKGVIIAGLREQAFFVVETLSFYIQPGLLLRSNMFFGNGVFVLGIGHISCTMFHAGNCISFVRCTVLVRAF